MFMSYNNCCLLTCMSHYNGIKYNAENKIREYVVAMLKAGTGVDKFTYFYNV